MKKRIVVFAPHPGDEIWGCGGTIAKKINEGCELSIVVMTDGRYSFLKMLGISSEPSPEELKEIREKEEKRAANVLGVKEENITFLNFVDSELEKNSEEAQEKVIRILNEIRPSEIYYTYEKDYHPDHKAACQIIRSSTKKMNFQVSKYEYSISQDFARIGPKIDAFLNLFKKNQIYVDVSEFLPLKAESAEELKSEIEIISHRQKEPLESKNHFPQRFLREKEIFYIDR